MTHLPNDWLTTTSTQNDCPLFIHDGCEGRIVLSRPQPEPDKACDLAQCDTCGKTWARKNARYRWASQNPGRPNTRYRRAPQNPGKVTP